MTLKYARYTVVGMLVSLIASPLFGTAETRHSVTMPDGPSLSFVQPTDWSVATEEAGPSVTVELSPTAGGDFLVLITIFPLQPDSPISTAEGLRATVLGVGEQKLATALQESIELTEVRGGRAIGYLYHLTDRNPERGPGDYREATQGMMLVTPYVASVTILTHSEDASGLSTFK